MKVRSSSKRPYLWGNADGVAHRHQVCHKQVYGCLRYNNEESSDIPQRHITKSGQEPILCVRNGGGSSTLNRGGVRLQRKRGSRHTFSWHAPQHNQERRIVMDPTTVFCPNLAGSARGHIGQGTIGIHSQKEKRDSCTACRKTFTTTNGTALYRLRTAADTVSP